MKKLLLVAGGLGLLLLGLLLPITYEQPPCTSTARTVVPAEQLAADRHLTLLGGWKIAQTEHSFGQMAIDFQANRLYMLCDWVRQEIGVYDLPELVQDTNPDRWPVATQTYRLSPWWPLQSPSGAVNYCNGLLWSGSKLWCAPRAFYEMFPEPTTLIIATDGDRFTAPLAGQRFAGFVKTGPEGDTFLGCGGYESGQGTCSGPTLGLPDGTILLQYGWPELPGSQRENWPLRAPRPADYWPLDRRDSWVAWNPRGDDGRWASDRLYGGGLLSDKLRYFPFQGTGPLAYSNQTLTFSQPGWNVTRCYEYDPETLELVNWFDFGFHGPIGGQEIDAQGRLYLAQAYGAGENVLLRVYRVNRAD